MGRFNSSGSTGHKCKHISGDYYEIFWTVDFYYVSSRLRFPRRFQRSTNEKGARKFCKKWKIDFDRINEK